MADILMLIEEQRAALREAERELGEAVAAKSEWEKKIAYLQWHLERLKRLYNLTSTLAQDEASHAGRIRSHLPPLPEKPKASEGRPGTTKQAMIEVLKEAHRPMTAREIWGVLQERGIKIKSERPAEVVASTLRSSMVRGQNIFTKDGPKFGLVEWQRITGA